MSLLLWYTMAQNDLDYLLHEQSKTLSFFTKSVVLTNISRAFSLKKNTFSFRIRYLTDTGRKQEYTQTHTQCPDSKLKVGKDRALQYIISQSLDGLLNTK